jgi:acyl-CoA dehydrogenase
MGPGRSAAGGERELLRQTVEDLLAGHCTPERVAATAQAGWDPVTWQALEEAGLTLVGAPEETGGSGGDLSLAADIAVAAGAAAAPVPLAETMAAGLLLGRVGMPIPPGPLTLAVAGSHGRTLRRVPYGRLATTVAAGFGENGEWLAVITPPTRASHGRNLAGEPRDDITSDAEMHEAAPGTAEYARRLLRLFRSLLIAGAAQRALELTVAYVTEREQFGRPLGRLPTVQAELARMAGEVALISAATQAAVADDPPPGHGASAVTAAKAQASHCAGTVAAIAHQLHGAIGTTEEHRLRLTTTRLWSWRDEDGPATECFAELGWAALRAGAGGLWPWLCGS